jgi:hypothetical protein
VTTQTFALADDVAWLDVTEGGEVVYATSLPDGPPVVLRATGRLIFTAAAAGGSLDVILERVAAASEMDPDTIRDEVSAFVDDLVTLGLLARH